MAYDRTVILPVDPHTAFELVTQPERIRRWGAVAIRIDLHLGGEFRWTVSPGNSAMGTITEVEPDKCVVFAWGWDGSAELPPGTSQLTLTLEPVAGGTSLRLVHEGLTPQLEADHAEGWNHYLDRLVHYAASGKEVADPWAAAPENPDKLTSAEAVLSIAQRVLAAVKDTELANPTPCADFNLAELIDHQYDTIKRIAISLGVDASETPHSSFEMRLADLSQKIIEAFRIRGQVGVLNLGANEVPATIVANILNIDLLVHAIDIAKSTHQEIEVSPVLVEYVLGLTRETITPEVRMNGSFAEEIVIDDSRDSLSRLLAFTGRAV